MTYVLYLQLPSAPDQIKESNISLKGNWTWLRNYIRGVFFSKNLKKKILPPKYFSSVSFKDTLLIQKRYVNETCVWRPHALNFNASKGSRKNTSDVFHFLFHFFPTSVLVTELCFQIKTSKYISKLEKGGQGQGRGHLIYYLLTLELQGTLMIYQDINPVVCTILIICLHEKSDKYIILFLHCRFYMSLPFRRFWAF